MWKKRLLFASKLLLKVIIISMILCIIGGTFFLIKGNNKQNDHILNDDNVIDNSNNDKDTQKEDENNNAQSQIDNNNDSSINNLTSDKNTDNSNNLSNSDMLIGNIFFNYSGQYELKIGSEVKLYAYLNTKDNNITESVSWVSSNSTIASVKGGLVSAKKEGTVTITGTYENQLKTTLKVIVKEKGATNIGINNCETGIKLKVDETKTLSYTITPTSSKKPTWTSANNDIVSVNSSGKITAKNDGKAVITVDISGYKASCNVEVYSTYTAQIIRRSSSTNIFYNTTENLAVLTKNHNGTNITSGLSYKWYLNGKEISGASDDTYSTTKYGAFSVAVYKSGKHIANATYNSSATAINYTIDTSDTKFIYVNNPEKLNDNAFIDNGRVIHKTSFDKNAELYFEHSRNTLTPFYYGVRIYNPTNQNVTLTINKSGASACYNGCHHYAKTWEEYYTSNITYRKDPESGNINLKESYVLTPGQYLYFWVTQDPNMKGKVKFLSTISDYKYAPYNDYLPDNTIPINNTWSWAFDGVLNLTAKLGNGNYLSSIGGKLEVSNIAVSKAFYKSENKDKINKTSTLATKETGTLTGEYNGKPLVTNNAKFIIDDATVKGTLLTYYSGTVDNNNLNLFGGWVTNMSGKEYTNAYQREMIPLSGLNSNGLRYTFSPFNDILTANYAVHYLENITVVNNSSKSRNVAFYVNSGSGNSTQNGDTTLVAFVTNNSRGIVKNNYKINGATIYPNATFDIFYVRTNIKVWSATIPPNTTITVPSITLLGGMSYAPLIKMMCVDNTCFDASAQKEFTW